LRRLLPEAVVVLRDRYGAKDVILFGSLATGACRDNSDVDMAVRGVTRSLYFAALADLVVLFGVPVDLVRLEEARKSLRGRILAEGEIL
jgi:predicted nucleotidyltransferase